VARRPSRWTSRSVFINESDRASGYHMTRCRAIMFYGGLVFTPLSLDYRRTLGGDAAEAGSWPL